MGANSDFVVIGRSDDTDLVSLNYGLVFLWMSVTSAWQHGGHPKVFGAFSRGTHGKINLLIVHPDIRFHSKPRYTIPFRVFKKEQPEVTTIPLTDNIPRAISHDQGFYISGISWFYLTWS